MVQLGKDRISDFLKACDEACGKPKNQGKHGLKLSLPYNHVITDDVGNDTLGSIHVTIYLSTGKVMAKGTCYMLWHAEHLPHLLDNMVSYSNELLAINAHKNDEAAHGTDLPNNAEANEDVSNCCICDVTDTERMLACDACGQWLHYSCSKLFPETHLLEITSTEDATNVCWRCKDLPLRECNTPVTEMDKGHTCNSDNHGSILQAIAKMESSIAETLSSLVNKNNVALQGKVDAELCLIADRYKVQLSNLDRAVSEAKHEKARIHEETNIKYTTKITLLREQNATQTESISATKETQSVWKAHTSALKAQITELECDHELKSK